MSNIPSSEIYQAVIGDRQMKLVASEGCASSRCASSRSCNMHCLLSCGEQSLICIRGTRGIGKTHLLLQLGRVLSQKDGNSLSSLETVYVNLNHFYFSSHTIYHFAQSFYRRGGKVLLLDQVFKYPGWSGELMRCHHDFPSLKIIFTASSVMTLEEEYPELHGVVRICDLYGFSFREYLNEQFQLQLPSYTLSQILKDHPAIAAKVKGQVDPWAALDGYFRHGYYPHHMDASLFGENLAKNMNMLLEVDLVYIRQIAPTYLPRLRKLLYLVSEQHDGVTNVSSLSEAIDISRATVMNYLKYLADARLIRMIYKEGSEYPKKPDRIFLNDTNILRVMKEETPNPLLEAKTFLLASLQDGGVAVHLSEDSGVDFCLNHQVSVRCLGRGCRRRSGKHSTYNILCDKNQRSSEYDLPLWLFGLLY